MSDNVQYATTIDSQMAGGVKEKVTISITTKGGGGGEAKGGEGGRGVSKGVARRYAL